MSRIYLFIFLFCFFFNLNAQDFEHEGIGYYVYNNGLYVSPLNKGYSGDISIPSQIEHNNISYDVIGIGDRAFSGMPISSIILPPSIKSIGFESFYNSGLSSLIFSENSCMVEIGDDAFRGCQNLIHLDIPNSVTTIGKGAFINCINLESISLPNELLVIPNVCFSGCTKLESLIIPNKVTSISLGAIEGCNNLKYLTIGENVSYISTYNFCNENTKLRWIRCLNATPPNISYPLNYEPFSSYIYENVVLQVPSDSWSLYRSAEYWRKFKNMESHHFSGVRDVEDNCSDIPYRYYDMNGNCSNYPFNGLNIILLESGKTIKQIFNK